MTRPRYLAGACIHVGWFGWPRRVRRDGMPTEFRFFLISFRLASGNLIDRIVGALIDRSQGPKP